MDNLMIEFLKVYHPNVSSLDILRQLVICCPNNIKHTVIPITGASNSGPIIYFARIIIETDNALTINCESFVANDHCEDEASLKAADLAIDYLKKVGNIKQEKEDETRFNNLHLMKNLRSMGRTKPNEQELDQIIANLKGDGFEIDKKTGSFLDPNTYDTVYYCKIDIPGGRKFCCESPNEDETYKQAAETLKDFLNDYISSPCNSLAIEACPSEKIACQDVQPMPNQMIMQTQKAVTFNFPEPSFEHIDSHFGDFINKSSASVGLVAINSPGQGNNNHLMPTSLSLEVSNPPHFTSQAEQLIFIINQFNSVYHPKKAPFAVVRKLYKRCSSAFKINTEACFEPNLANHFKTVIHLNQSASATATASTKKESRHIAMRQLFDPLKNLSELFVVFKAVNSPLKTPEDVVNDLINVTEKGLVRFRTERLSASLYKSNIIIVNLLSVVEHSSTESVSRQNVAKRVVAHLQQLSTQIQDSSHIVQFALKTIAEQITPPLPSPPISFGTVATTAQYSRQIIDAQFNGTVQSLSSRTSLNSSLVANKCAVYLLPRELKLAELITLFNSVYDHNKLPSVVLNEMHQRDQACFQVATRVIEGDLYLSSVTSSDLGTFFGDDFTEVESREKCMTIMFDTLAKIKQLVENFLYLDQAYIGVPPVNFIPILIAENPEIIRFHVLPKDSDSTFQARVDIDNMRCMTQIAATDKEAIAILFTKLAEYLRKFVGKIGQSVARPIQSVLKQLPVPALNRVTTDGEMSDIRSRNLKKIEILNLFNSVYSPAKNQVAVMDELIAFCPTLVSMVIRTLPNGQYRAILQIGQIQTFQVTTTSEESSRKGAMKAAFRRLNNLSFLFSVFRSKYSPIKPPAQVLDLILEHHSELVYYNTTITASPGGGPSFLTQVDILNFGSFMSADDTPAQSLAAALEQAVDFLCIISQWIILSPHSISFIWNKDLQSVSAGPSKR